jgi:hypothetical protein
MIYSLQTKKTDNQKNAAHDDQFPSLLRAKRSDTSLKAVTPHGRRNIEGPKQTTHGAVVASYRDSAKGPFPKHTLQRASMMSFHFLPHRYVQKVDKTLIWAGELSRDPAPFAKDMDQARRRIQSKEQVLQYKTRLPVRSYCNESGDLEICDCPRAERAAVDDPPQSAIEGLDDRGSR